MDSARIGAVSGILRAAGGTAAFAPALAARAVPGGSTLRVQWSGRPWPTLPLPPSLPWRVRPLAAVHPTASLARPSTPHSTNTTPPALGIVPWFSASLGTQANHPSASWPALANITNQHQQRGYASGGRAFLVAARCSSSSTGSSANSSDESSSSSSDSGGVPSDSSSAGEAAADEPAIARNEVEGGRSVEWMGDDREVEIASRLVAKWKQDKKDKETAAAAAAGGSGEARSMAAPSPPPQDVLLKAVSDLSRIEGRNARTTNVVMGGTAASQQGDDWLELDKKVNQYPTLRDFTAIGTGGGDFVESMVDAVESVLETSIPKCQVSARESARGNYVSVKIGPVRMESSDQVRAVYEAMRKDERMRYFL